MPERLTDFSRLALHTITTKPWTLAECLEHYAELGIGGVSVWREHVEPVGVPEAARLIRESGLTPVSYVRGGFFCATSGIAREEAKARNHMIIDEAAAMGLPMVVLVCGAVPGLPLADARYQIMAGIQDILGHAEDAGIRLAIEPLHPMYADNRSAINTMEQANNIVTSFDSAHLGIAVDVYHTWWDPYLRAEIDRSKGKVFAFHVSDWRTPTVDIVNDRGIMGEGCIEVRKIRGWVEQTGFQGWNEVEIFSERLWNQDQTSVVERIKLAYLKHT